MPSGSDDVHELLVGANGVNRVYGDSFFGGVCVDWLDNEIQIIGWEVIAVLQGDCFNGIICVELIGDCNNIAIAVGQHQVIVIFEYGDIIERDACTEAEGVGTGIVFGIVGVVAVVVVDSIVTVSAVEEVGVVTAAALEEVVALYILWLLIGIQTLYVQNSSWFPYII